MTDKVQKIREEVERLKRWNDNVRESTRHMTSQEEVFNRGKHSSYLEILNFIDSLQEESVSENLEEAAFDYAEACKYEGGEKLLCVEHFKAGAKWQFNQLEKNRLTACYRASKEEIEREQETLHFILEDLCDQLDDTSDEGDREILNREIAFLRSLEPQPKYRWSAEDNKIRAQITKYFECQIESEPTRKDVLLKWIAWVANLRPQIQWKPSEEQMKCLKDACDKHWEPDGLDPLYTLYEQLKAL